MSTGVRSSMKQLFENQLSGWPIAEVVSWLLTEGRQIEPTTALIQELCERLVAAGAPLIRARVSLLTLHPQVRDFSFTWHRGQSARTGRVHHVAGHSTQDAATRLRDDGGLTDADGEHAIVAQGRRDVKGHARLQHPIDATKQAQHIAFPQSGAKEIPVE